MSSVQGSGQTLTPLQRSVLVIEKLKAKLNALEARINAPIAIVGMGCRLPGNVRDPQSFWELLCTGTNAIDEVPADRWDVNAYYDRDPEVPGKMSTRYGGFLPAVDQFDPQFFGISPREAVTIDPQHRLLLEVSWEALEQAGIIPSRPTESTVGVFVGITLNDYGTLAKESLSTQGLEGHYVTGLPLNAAAGRIAYTFGFTGPTVAIDTACSSSLVAVHQACQSLRQGECEMALAAGVNLILLPDSMITTSNAGMLSPDGRCKTFDAAADGIGRGEGCGVVILKRLSDALAHGDNVLAIIRGSAVNQDGPSSGFTVPSRSAQETLIRKALAAARVTSEDVSYVEAHGTGTPLGDPIELRALAALFKASRSAQEPLILGSVKTNVGHLEAAAGIVSLIKVVLQLQHRQIAPHINFTTPTPHVDWQKMPVSIPTTIRPWTAVNDRRIAGVSAFGASGTNAHLVVEEFCRRVDNSDSSPAVGENDPSDRPLHVLTLSARTETGLLQLLNRYRGYFQTASVAIADVCYSANIGRAHLNHRVAIVADTTAALQSQLEILTADYSQSATAEVVQGGYRHSLSELSAPAPKVAFLFTGQGSQSPYMGQQLYQTQPLFRQTLDRCAHVLANYLDVPLLELLYPASNANGTDLQSYINRLNKTAYTQPVLFALEYALAQVWIAWIGKPDVVMGHSVGEYVAACIAGVFSLEDALRLIVERGRLMQALPQDGLMVAVEATPSEVKVILDCDDSEVEIAAINGPRSLVISGRHQAVTTTVSKLEVQGIKTKSLQVSHAFHSPLMEPMLADFAQVAAGITYGMPKIPLISNVTGKRAGPDIATPHYWVRHIRQPVQFEAGMRTLWQQKCRIFLEIGPKSTLLAMGQACIPEYHSVETVCLPSLRPNQPDWLQMLRSLAHLYVLGVKVDWQQFDQEYSRCKVDLPLSPFQRQRYWVTPSNQSVAAKLQEHPTSSVIDLLQKGDLQALADVLEFDHPLNAQQRQTLNRLFQKHQQQTVAIAVQDLLYNLEWHKSPLIEEAQQDPETVGDWLVFAPFGPQEKAIVSQLQQTGYRITWVTLGDMNGSPPEGVAIYAMENLKSSEFERLWHFLQTQATPSITLQGILYCPGFFTPLYSTLSEQVNTLCTTLLQLMQGLLTHPFETSPKLWVLTQNAVAVEAFTETPSVEAEPMLSLAYAPVWGLSRVFGLENAQLWGGLIDLDNPTNTLATQAQAIIADLRACQEDQIAYRQGTRYVARLVKRPSPPLAKDISATIHPDATYLITGGLGGLGLVSAQWLAAKGARYLILLSRSGGNTEQRREAVTYLTEAGVNVLTPMVDVADQAAMAKLFTQIPQAFPPLRGIIHAAGVGGFNYISELCSSDLETVLASKVAGTWNLHELSRSSALDFFICFSSIASVWGSVGQAHYAAANQFLDAFAAYRQQLGLSALTINWSAVTGAGMLKTNNAVDLEQYLSRIGVGRLHLSQVTASLEFLLATETGQHVVAPVDWDRFRNIYEAGRRRPLLDNLGQSDTDSESISQGTKAFLKEQLEANPAAKQLSLLQHLLQREVGQVLGLPATELPATDVGFFELGMDSLMAVELKSRLSQQLGDRLPATLAFDFPNIERLSQYIGNEVLGLSLTAPSTPSVTVQTHAHDPIAIVGMACRFPAGIDTPDDFWQLLQTGGDTRSQIPSERWNLDNHYDPDPDIPGKMYTRFGHFLTAVDQFDPGFFGISPREATAMDPQHRLLLEVSWEALERAGHPVDRLSEAPVGVFIGNDGQDYPRLLARHLEHHPDSPLSTYLGTGVALSSAPGRIAYAFGFTGPAMAIDTACSSSLVAVHQACNSLRQGECSVALAGGIKLHLTPDGFIGTSKAKMLAPDGRCKTFDASADGYARGEGCGMVVLKPLSQAIADRDNVLAVIRGSAVNQDGPSGGLTVPNGQAQQRLLRQALVNAGVEPGEIDYLEAHGTGTSLGDPIELTAAAAVLGEGHSTELPLWIGAVKTNIGHLEAAAGISGLIKVVLGMQHRVIPPHLHCQSPNPNLDWSQMPMQVVQRLMPWPEQGQPLAGISSFGFTGTNAHVIVEAAPSLVAPELPDHEFLGESPWQVLTLSAKNAEALKSLVHRYHHHLATHPHLDLGDICFSANTGRTAFAHRLALVAKTYEDMQLQLQYVATQEGGNEGPGWDSLQHYNMGKSSKSADIVFLFTGQGSQFEHMGRQLYETLPIFRETLNTCDRLLQSELDHSLLEVLYPPAGEPSLLHTAAYTQPALFAVEYALACVWRDWGIEPDAVMGHSLGEYVAACVAGVFSLGDALKLVAARGRLMHALPANGTMISLMASSKQVGTVIQTLGNRSDEVAIAAINGPQSTVIAGCSASVNAVAASLTDQGIKARPLRVSHAFHSPLMAPMVADFEQVAQQITYQAPAIKLISNVTGQVLTPEDLTSAYWCCHILSPVQFAAGMTCLHQISHQAEHQIFIECGPKPTLLSMGRDCLPDGVGHWIPSLRSGQEDWETLLHSLGELYVQGIPVNWQAVYRSTTQRKVNLPTYPWQHQRYWVETPELSTATVNGGTSSPTDTAEASTSIVQLLQQGDTQKLTQLLLQNTDFSAEQTQLLPTLVEYLVEQQHQQEQPASLPDWFYDVEWQPQGRFIDGQCPNYLPEANVIAQTLQPTLAELISPEGLAQHTAFMAQLETLSVDYIVMALQDMGWQFPQHQSFTTAAVAQQLGIVSQQRKLFERLLEILATVGIVQADADSWQVRQQPDPPQSPSQALAVAELPAEAVLLQQCGNRLSDVLLGVVDPVHVLFPAGDTTTLTRLYQDSPGNRVMNTLAQKALTTALTDLPADRAVRILEIGAGTGATASYLLPQLNPHQTEYVFTDIGQGFLTLAQEKFQDFPFISYQLLDIETDPQGQGFEPHSYDIIIATNVLHATQSLATTLRHVQQLLSPGGLLILIEATERQRWLDLTFGLLDGWWRFTDYDQRPNHPLLDAATWGQVLLDNGFNSVKAVPSPENSGSLILAKTAPNPVTQAVKNWLILADQQGVGQGLADQLEASGDQCTLVFAGQHDQQRSANIYTVNPQTSLPSFISQRLAETTIHGIIHCWAIDNAQPPNLKAFQLPNLLGDSFKESLHQGCGTALSVVQGIVQEPPSTIPRLWFVTQGAQATPAVSPGSAGLNQSLLWGFGKSLDLEHPELQCVRVDLAVAVPLEQQIQNLWAEIISTHPEEQVALRGENRYVARLARRHFSPPRGDDKTLSCQPSATYLITGGLGGLGLLLADWLVQRGARHLVLVTRGGMRTAAEAPIARMRAMGVKVVVAQADVSDPSALSQVIEDIEQSLPPLRGILHAAGVLSDGIIRQQTWETFLPVMGPKVLGSWYLHQLTQELSLDFFVLFSSTASLFGSRGQSNHAAANAFLDSLAHFRQSQGLPALSIHWGPVSKVGAAANNDQLEAYIQKLGMGMIAPENVLQGMEVMIQSSLAEVAMVPIEWPTFLSNIPEQNSFLAHWQTVKLSLETTPETSEFRQKFQKMGPADRRDYLINHLQNQVSQILGFNSSQAISLKEGLFDLGMDSLTALEFRNRLQRSLQCSIPTTVAFDYPTLTDLVDFLLQQLLETDDPLVESVSEPMSTLVADIGHPLSIPSQDKEISPPSDPAQSAALEYLSDEEAETSLMQTLENLGF
ncbi:SDR family NAD(P)-dependent oxidoreductase [Leptothoe sp. EHU-05/26/07-4]